MKSTQGLMLAGIAITALGAAAIVATALSQPQRTQTAARAVQITDVTATPIPIDLSESGSLSIDVTNAEPLFLERAKADGFTLSPRAQSASEVIVDVEPCWLERPLPELPRDYRDLLKPGAMLCEGGMCLAGRPLDSASLAKPLDANQVIVDPLSAQISYQRDPNCVAPTPAP
jgi:hypothetical protein